MIRRCGLFHRVPGAGPFGSLPKIELRPEKDKDSGDLIGLNTLTRTKKGIPLGGIGAGNFMYNLCGSFGPWQLKAGRYEERFLPQAAFHVREEMAGEVNARILATDDVLPAWPRLKPGEREYCALFPKGWCSYKGFSSAISVQFFSPFPMGMDQDASKSARERRGLSNRVMKNPKSGVTAILMEAHDQRNAPETA